MELEAVAGQPPLELGGQVASLPVGQPGAASLPWDQRDRSAKAALRNPQAPAQPIQKQLSRAVVRCRVRRCPRRTSVR